MLFRWSGRKLSSIMDSGWPRRPAGMNPGALVRPLVRKPGMGLVKLNTSLPRLGIFLRTDDKYGIHPAAIAWKYGHSGRTNHPKTQRRAEQLRENLSTLA